MSILDRYIASEFWRAFFISLIAFVTLFISGDTLRQGVQQQVPAAYALINTLYQLPEIIVLLLPAACLMGTFIALSTLSRRSELIAMYSSAISLTRISFVILCLVFIICCISFIVTDRIIPPLAKKRAYFYRTVVQKKRDLHTEINQSRIWYRSKNLIYNLRAFDTKKNVIHGLAVYTFDNNFELVQQIEAKIARYVDSKWLLERGLVTIFDGDPIFPRTQKFETRAIHLNESPEDFKEIEREVETLRLKHLWRFIERNRQAGIDTDSYEVLFWSKISMALVPIIMSILAIPFGTRQDRHSGIAKDVTICFAFIITYWLFFSGALSMGKSGAIPPVVAAWLPSLVFFVTGVVLIVRDKQRV